MKNKTTISWKMIQDCQLPIGEDDYDKRLFIKMVSEMSQEDFNSFCKEVLHLTHFYDSNQGAYVSDLIPFIEENENRFWKLEEINFDAPVYFRKIQ